MIEGNLHIPETEQEAVRFFTGFRSSRSAQPVLVDSGSYYLRGTAEEAAIAGTAGFGSIAEVSGEDMLAVAGAGVKVEDLNEAAAEYGLHFPAGNNLWKDCTLAQLVDEAPVSDLRRIRGPIREYILSVRLVTPGGRLISSGSRAVKDVTGYDIIGLCAGSLGRYGLLTEVTVRLIPIPSSTGLILYVGSKGDIRNLSLEINRAAGQVCQYIFFGHAAELLTGGGFKRERDGAVLAVRFEAEPGTGKQRVEARIDAIARPGGLSRIEPYGEGAGLTELLQGAMGTDDSYCLALQLSAETSPDFDRAPGGITWADLYPARIHTLIPLREDEMVTVTPERSYWKTVAERAGTANSFRVDLLDRSGRKLPLGVNRLRSLLFSGSSRFTAGELAEDIGRPFHLRSRIVSPGPACRRSEEEPTGIGERIGRVFDPDGIMIER